jgi:hypothetical protein
MVREMLMMQLSAVCDCAIFTFCLHGRVPVYAFLCAMWHTMRILLRVSIVWFRSRIGVWQDFGEGLWLSYAPNEFNA